MNCSFFLIGPPLAQETPLCLPQPTSALHSVVSGGLLSIRTSFFKNHFFLFFSTPWSFLYMYIRIASIPKKNKIHFGALFRCWTLKKLKITQIFNEHVKVFRVQKNMIFHKKYANIIFFGLSIYQIRWYETVSTHFQCFSFSNFTFKVKKAKF